MMPRVIIPLPEIMTRLIMMSKVYTWVRKNAPSAFAILASTVAFCISILSFYFQYLDANKKEYAILSSMTRAMMADSVMVNERLGNETYELDVSFINTGNVSSFVTNMYLFLDSGLVFMDDGDVFDMRLKSSSIWLYHREGENYMPATTFAIVPNAPVHKIVGFDLSDFELSSTINNIDTILYPKSRAEMMSKIIIQSIDSEKKIYMDTVKIGFIGYWINRRESFHGTETPIVVEIGRDEVQQSGECPGQITCL